MWGGRGAPLFVKGGELFKDGEVEVVKQDGKLHTIFRAAVAAEFVR